MTFLTLFLLVLLGSATLASYQSLPELGLKKLRESDPMQKEEENKYKRTDPLWDDIMLGVITGFGYGSLLLLPDTCEEAGFEIVPSGYMIYNWFTIPGFSLYERVLGPLGDYLQIVLQFIFM